MAAVKPIPDGYPRLTPYLIVGDGAAAIAFYQKAFGARLRLKLDAPGGRIGHAELEIGDSLIMLADEFPEMSARSPKTVGGTPMSLHVYVEDADSVFDRAIKNFISGYPQEFLCRLLVGKHLNVFQLSRHYSRPLAQILN